MTKSVNPMVLPPPPLPDHTQLPEPDDTFVKNFQEHPPKPDTYQLYWPSFTATASRWPVLQRSRLRAELERQRAELTKQAQQLAEQARQAEVQVRREAILQLLELGLSEENLTATLSFSAEEVRQFAQ